MRPRIAAAAAVLLLCLGLAGCSGEAAPEDIDWTLVAQGDIVSMDSTTGVYVEGYIGHFGGSVDSRGVIDYKYARELKDGGLRQDLVSSTYDRIVPYGEYPGSSVVTIYQDARPDGSDARILVYRCDLKDDAAYGRCVMPDGQSMDGADHRVEVHVPPNSVVQKFDESGDSTGEKDQNAEDGNG